VISEQTQEASSLSLVELEQLQSTEQAGLPFLLATLLTALSNPAAAFAQQNPRALAPHGQRPVSGPGHKLAVPIGARNHQRRLQSAVRMSQKSDTGDLFFKNNPLTWRLSNRAFAQNLCGLDSKQRPRALFFYDGG